MGLRDWWARVNGRAAEPVDLDPVVLDKVPTEEDLLAAANRQERASDSLTKSEFKALESQASFDKVLFDGGEFGLGGLQGVLLHVHQHQVHAQFGADAGAFQAKAGTGAGDQNRAPVQHTVAFAHVVLIPRLPRVGPAHLPN